MSISLCCIDLSGLALLLPKIQLSSRQSAESQHVDKQNCSFVAIHITAPSNHIYHSPKIVLLTASAKLYRFVNVGSVINGICLRRSRVVDASES
jgi:hypothetical protein